MLNPSSRQKPKSRQGSSWHPDRLQAASGPGLLGFMARPAARDASWRRGLHMMQYAIKVVCNKS